MKDVTLKRGGKMTVKYYGKTQINEDGDAIAVTHSAVLEIEASGPAIGK